VSQGDNVQQKIAVVDGRKYAQIPGDTLAITLKAEIELRKTLRVKEKKLSLMYIKHDKLV
jgi:hypothetical protein